MDEPTGIILQFERATSRTEEEIGQATLQFHRQVQSLPGYRAAAYSNIGEQSYSAVISFESAAATASALELLGPALRAQYPELKVAKGEVVFAHLDPRLQPGA